jgi:hypothetical protein
MAKVKCLRSKGFVIQGTGGWGIDAGEIKVISDERLKDPKFKYYVENGSLQVMPENAKVTNPAVPAKKDVTVGTAAQSKEFQTNAAGAVVTPGEDTIIPKAERRKTIDELANGPTKEELAEYEEEDEEVKKIAAPVTPAPEIPKKAKSPKKGTPKGSQKTGVPK